MNERFDPIRFVKDGRTITCVLGLILCGLPGCGETIPQVEGLEIEVTDENFAEEVLENDLPVLVDFGATWCTYCEQMEPAVAYLSVQFEGQLAVGKVDCDESPQASSEYDIDSLPAFVLFRDGQEIARTSGAMRYRTLSAWVDRHLAQ